jgi:hypothetical protein
MVGNGKNNESPPHYHPRTGADLQLYSFFKPGARLGWVINAMPPPLYHQE